LQFEGSIKSRGFLKKKEQKKKIIPLGFSLKYLRKPTFSYPHTWEKKQQKNIYLAVTLRNDFNQSVFIDCFQNCVCFPVDYGYGGAADDALFYNSRPRSHRENYSRYAILFPSLLHLNPNSFVTNDS